MSVQDKMIKNNSLRLNHFYCFDEITVVKRPEFTVLYNLQLEKDVNLLLFTIYSWKKMYINCSLQFTVGKRCEFTGLYNLQL